MARKDRCFCLGSGGEEGPAPSSEADLCCSTPSTRGFFKYESTLSEVSPPFLPSALDILPERCFYGWVVLRPVL